MSTSMTAYSQDMTNQLSLREPTQVLEEAKRAAVALKGIIDAKPNKVIFNKEVYLEFEDWQTVGRFYGCTVRVDKTQYVEYGGVHGFEATAVVLDRNQNVISQAESLCLSDEENWGMVSAYEWQDKLGEDGKKIWNPKGGKKGTGAYEREQVKVGEKPKPLFQLKSMAQTRACARALRQVFAWVVVLAGYKPSVAEEMTGDEQPRNDADQQTQKEPVKQPGRASEAVIEEFSGKIDGAKFGANDILWMHLGERLVMVPQGKVTDDLVNGNILTVEAKKMKSEKIGEYWQVGKVIKLEVVQEATVVSAEDEIQEGSAEDVQEHPADETPHTEELKTMFDNGTVKTGREVADAKTETEAKKEQSWRAHIGHDPERHISYKQGALLFKIQKELKISEEQIKEHLSEHYSIKHRYLFPKAKFEELLDEIDPDNKFHEKKF